MPTVKMADGTLYNVNALLSNGDTNAKMRKSNAAGKGYLTVGLSLSPAKESGYETCASRSPGCTQACLFTAGRGAMSNVKRARIAKTRLYFQDRATFKAMLTLELAAWQSKAEKQGKMLACRLNVVSDIPWEKVFPDMFTLFPNVQFYDYTKHVKRAFAYSLSREHNDDTFFPLNYHLTFSRSETNVKETTQVTSGSWCNVAVVFDSKDIPETWAGRKVIDGDETDLRFTDEPKTIVGLYAKGKGKKDLTGFIIPTLSLIKR